MSKRWAFLHLTAVPVTVIPNVLYLWRASNLGASAAVGTGYMELCLTLPATLVFCIYLSLVRWEKKGFRPGILMQLGLASLTGGALSNWSERVIYHHVTDFCYTPALHELWNLADVFITFGFLLIGVGAILKLPRPKMAATAKKS